MPKRQSLTRSEELRKKPLERVPTSSREKAAGTASTRPGSSFRESAVEINRRREEIGRMRKTATEPYCWNCGRDPRGRKLLTVPEAAEICGVASTTVYRWMDEYRVQWILTAGGRRRIDRDSLIRHAAVRRLVRERNRVARRFIGEEA
jgi:excisionase family DNA binding protein